MMTLEESAKITLDAILAGHRMRLTDRDERTIVVAALARRNWTRQEIADAIGGSVDRASDDARRAGVEIVNASQRDKDWTRSYMESQRAPRKDRNTPRHAWKESKNHGFRSVA